MNLDFSKARILVVGDIMLDSYWQGSTQRISPEAPVPVVQVNDMTKRIGGSGNVAMNITSLGGSASLFALTGDDVYGRELSDLLKQTGIHNYCQVDPAIQTTSKLRVLSQHQQLIRLDFEKPHHEVDISPLLAQYEQALSAADVVVISDYAKGLLEDAQPFIQLANKHSVPVLIDPKKTSFENYAGAWLLTPNQKEFESVVGKIASQDDLVDKARNVIAQNNLHGLLITQGEKGMTLVVDNQPAEHFPAHAKEVYDVTGAGDTVIAAVSIAVASGYDLTDAVNLSCKAAAIVVGRVGTASATVEDIQQLDRQESSKLSSINAKIMDQQGCLQAVDRLRKQGKKIVFTNGCFDLIHAGHVLYLEAAANLGDLLIVAVNSDESVRQLKGDDRPVNDLADRMQVLAGLASVDIVVSFTEQTP
ncbi:MAG: bifunctional D-glycero-beta-D-manno-heptose-7-phosphate kinase/D-glycero-beta-D-manno-heptose 1-phosphate adenylyltransferase HldE, partial [Gammaproteobacteria bacterium]|nr:bifunctional D-glycero-beta-D-manno-heptose-7-phosphate kinase/D-glycero-beta-D-manno-heptose 1-phosphate adenylyltransferase HldE [Gammaproteobacteria bacterium]